jgi:2'-hydroxyisoflavone reductase
MIVLKVLILGGTTFLGPHLVEELQERGHEVTLFNRGTHVSQVETLRGNRDGDLEALKNRHWDAIIDTSGHLPQLVEASSKILVKATNHYTFVSTIEVYRDFQELHIDESYPLADEKIQGKTDGALKAACESIVERYFPQHLIIRPGLIVGPRDPTHRFSYWPLRVAEGGEILVPGSPLQKIQFIDVRDLAKWMVTLVERQQTGVYNATGPAQFLSFGELLNTCAQVSGKEVSFTWVSEDFPIQQGLLWLSYLRNGPGFLSIDATKAIQAGLTFRPLADTISATLDWEKAMK